MEIKKFVSWTTEGNKLMLVNAANQKCIVLDDTGNLLWNKILAGYNKEEIVKQCAAQFPDSDINVICRDIEDFLLLLVDNGIIQA